MHSKNEALEKKEEPVTQFFQSHPMKPLGQREAPLRVLPLSSEENQRDGPTSLRFQYVLLPRLGDGASPTAMLHAVPIHRCFRATRRIPSVAEHLKKDNQLANLDFGKETRKLMFRCFCKSQKHLTVQVKGIGLKKSFHAENMENFFFNIFSPRKIHHLIESSRSTKFRAILAACARYAAPSCPKSR